MTWVVITSLPYWFPFLLILTFCSWSWEFTQPEPDRLDPVPFQSPCTCPARKGDVLQHSGEKQNRKLWLFFSCHVRGFVVYTASLSHMITAEEFVCFTAVTPFFISVLPAASRQAGLELLLGDWGQWGVFAIPHRFRLFWNCIQREMAR